jgi:hypothetical protein
MVRCGRVKQAGRKDGHGKIAGKDPRQTVIKARIAEAAKRALAEAEAAAKAADAKPPCRTRRAGRSRANPLWRLGKEGHDLGLLSRLDPPAQGPCKR